MNRSILTAQQAAWLTETFTRNRDRFAGWSMDATDDAAAQAAADAEAAAAQAAEAAAAAAAQDAKGYPDNTRPEDMKAEEQAAYYRAQARKHEDRNKDLLKLTGGKYGDDLKADLDELGKLRTDRLTDSERAVEDARKTAREEAQREFGPKMARLAFDTALAHRDDREDLIAALNLTSVLTDDGDVDTAKVRSIVEKIAPADKDKGAGRHNFGAGRRGGITKTGVSTGAEMFAARRTPTNTTDS